MNGFRGSGFGLANLQPFSMHSAAFNQDGMGANYSQFGQTLNYTAMPKYQTYKGAQIKQPRLDPPKPPCTIGTSVMGIKFKGGVSIAADNKISFGLLARYNNIERVVRINKNIILGAYGNFADFQQLKLVIEQQILADCAYDDGHTLQPRALYNWMCNVMHTQRSQQKPLFVNVIIGGVEDGGDTFLGAIDLRGLGYEAKDVIALGSSKILAKPVIQERIKSVDRLSKEDAYSYLKSAMEILYYRDTTSMCEFSIATVTKHGSSVTGPVPVDENWRLAKMIIGY